MPTSETANQEDADTDLLVQIGKPIPNVTQVIALPGHTLQITFDTGEQGTLHLPTYLGSSHYYSPLIAGDFYKQVFIDHGTLCWPGNIDLDPVVVHAWTMGIPIELA